jgi:hypothetical protein
VVHRLTARPDATGGSAGTVPVPPPGVPADRTRPDGERGSQTLELALLLPALGVVIALVLHAGLLASEVVLAQAAARDAARVASVEGDAAARDAAAAVSGDRGVRLVASPAEGRRRAGDLVTVRVEVESGLLRRFGIEVWLPAEATMRVEGP